MASALCVKDADRRFWALTCPHRVYVGAARNSPAGKPVLAPLTWQPIDRSWCTCRAKMDGPYDSRVLPVLLASILMVALIIVFSGAIAQAAGWT